MLQDVEKRFFNKVPLIESKKEILHRYLDYVECKVEEGHNLPKMLKHLFGLSRGDKNAKVFRIKIIEAMKENKIKPFRDDLDNLLVY